MNIGSLYRVKEYYWMVFPSKESVAHAAGGTVLALALPHASSVTAYYSEKFKENVSPDSFIVFLEEDGNLRKVLTSEGLIGWTWFDYHFNDLFEEVKSE